MAGSLEVRRCLRTIPTARWRASPTQKGRPRQPFIKIPGTAEDAAIEEPSSPGADQRDLLFRESSMSLRRAYIGRSSGALTRAWIRTCGRSPRSSSVAGTRPPWQGPAELRNTLGIAVAERTYASIEICWKRSAGNGSRAWRAAAAAPIPSTGTKTLTRPTSSTWTPWRSGHHQYRAGGDPSCFSGTGRSSAHCRATAATRRTCWPGSRERRRYGPACRRTAGGGRQSVCRLVAAPVRVDNVQRGLELGDATFEQIGHR